MATVSENHVFNLFTDPFTDYVFCAECFDYRHFKLYPSDFDVNGECELSKEQKDLYVFECCCEGRLNFLGFQKIIDRDFVKQLKINRKNFFLTEWDH